MNKHSIPNFGLLLLLLGYLLLAGCQSAPKPDRQYAQLPTDFWGDWYATDRHLKFQKGSPALIDSYTGPKGNWTEAYQIKAIEQHSPEIYLITLSPTSQKYASFQRIFVLTERKDTMREFLGRRIILWSRHP